MQGDSTSNEDLPVGNVIANESLDDDVSLDCSQQHSFRMEDMTIADLPDSEREKVSRLVDRLVSLGREQEEMVADLAYERSRHANEIETSNQQLQQVSLQFEFDKCQLEERVADGDEKRRAVMGLLQMYQLALEGYAGDNAALKEALAVAAVGSGQSVQTDSIPSEREKEMKDSILRLETLSASQHAMIETMQTVHLRISAEQQATAAELASTSAKLVSAEGRLGERNGQPVQQAAVHLDSPLSAQQQRYLQIMERACEGMARQLTEMALRLEDREGQIAALTSRGDVSRGEGAIIVTAPLLVSPPLLVTPSSPTLASIIAVPSVDMQQQGMENLNGHSTLPSAQQSIPALSPTPSAELPSASRQKRSKGKGGEGALKKSHPYLRSQEKEKERDRTDTALPVAKGVRSSVTIERRGEEREGDAGSEVDVDISIERRSRMSPTLSSSPKRKALNGSTRTRASNEDSRQQSPGCHSLRRSYGDDMSQLGGHNSYPEGPRTRESRRPPPFPSRPHTHPPPEGERLEGERVSTGHSRRSPPRDRERQDRPYSTHTASSMSSDFPPNSFRRKERVREDEVIHDRRDGKRTASNNDSSRYSVEAPSSSGPDRRAASSSLKPSHSYQPSLRLMESTDAHSHQPPRTRRPPSQGSILTINGTKSSDPHPYIPRDREKDKQRGGGQEKEQPRERSAFSFDGERDEYDLQLFDLLDRIEISSDNW